MLHKKKSSDKPSHQQIKETIRIYGAYNNIYGDNSDTLLPNSVQKRIERKQKLELQKIK